VVRLSPPTSAPCPACHETAQKAVAGTLIQYPA
jgi:hypothetical protein